MSDPKNIPLSEAKAGDIVHLKPMKFMQAFADRHQGGLQPDMFAAPAARKPRRSTKRKSK